jgi:hypothetical protein
MSKWLLYNSAIVQQNHGFVLQHHGEATYTNFIVFGLTRSVLEHTISDLIPLLTFSNIFFYKKNIDSWFIVQNALLEKNPTYNKNQKTGKPNKY